MIRHAVYTSCFCLTTCQYNDRMVTAYNIVKTLLLFIIAAGTNIRGFEDISRSRRSMDYDDPDDYDHLRPRPTPDSTLISAGCGNYSSFDGISGTITSPNYPNAYPDSIFCSYTIEVAEGNSANITFEDFLTESNSDWVQIRCSNGSNPYVSPTYSGTEVPPFMSFRSCRQIAIVFHSDTSISHKGFSLKYTIGEGISGGIISAPRNFYVSNEVPQQIVLSCESSASVNGSYPWWSFNDRIVSRTVTNTMCEVILLRGRGYDLSTSKSLGPKSSWCNVTISQTASYGDMQNYGFYTCTDSSLSTASAWVTRLPASVMIDRDNNGKETVKGDNITVTCNYDIPIIRSGKYHLNVSTYFSSATEDYIPTATSTEHSSEIIVTASPERLPSYTCHFNFSLSGYVAGIATNLPDDFTLSTKPQEVLFWPESETMTIIGALNGKMDKNGVLTCHASANPAPKYKWVDAASGISSAGPSVHVLHSGVYTCVASNFIKHRMYNASKTVTIEIVDQNADESDVTSAVGVVFGVIGLIIIGIYVAAFVILYRKIASLQGSIAQSVNMGSVSCHLPATNEKWENNSYDEHDKADLVNY